MREKLELILTLIKAFVIPILLVVACVGWYFDKKELIKTETVLKTERKSWETERKVAKENKVILEKTYTTTIKSAVSDYTNWVKQQKPVILQSVKTVKEYAKTDAGKSLCLDLDGVRRFSEQRALIFPEYSTSAPGSDSPVSSASDDAAK